MVVINFQAVRAELGADGGGPAGQESGGVQAVLLQSAQALPARQDCPRVQEGGEGLQIN
jgi:hypothetical protein